MSRVRPVAGPTISLFPFLAVLLCTMGALLVVLVLFSRAAQHSVSAAADADRRARAEELELAHEEIAWRIGQLTGIRDRTAADLARARMQLAGVEEDIRGLTDELEALERTAVAAAADAPPPQVDAATAADLERRLSAARAALEAALAKGAKKPAAYAVVPYAGDHGTHRRPLYIECCIDGVFLQPEGIRLSPGDFEGPPGPGNPLASALRAAREHIARGTGGSADPAAQPYPLLLVRPSGVMAYYAAREAIQSWGSEFGYQFIDEDWELNFPPRDPALAEVETRAVEESRQRLAWLAQVRPTRPARPPQQYRAAATRGGVISNGGPSVLGDQSRFDWTQQQADGDGGGTDRQTAGRGPGGPLGGRGTRDEGGGTSAAEAAWGGVDGDATGTVAGGSLRGSTGGGRYVGPSRFYAGERPAGEAVAADGEAGGGGPSSPRSGAAGTAARDGDAAATASPGGKGGAGSRSSAAAGAAVGQTGGTSGGSAAVSSSAAGGGASGPSLPGLAQGGGSAAAGGSADGASASVSLAGSRGSNWASMATHDRPIPLRRPIRVECAADEFRILDDGAGRVETRIPIAGPTAEAVDPLVVAVRSKVSRWGLAGDRMYWKPELVLTETADGRSRRQDLERLLADSGLDTRPAVAPDTVRPLPPLDRTSALLRSR